jgi:hypothetical protein
MFLMCSTGILGNVLTCKHELSEGEQPTTVVVACTGTALTVEVDPVHEVVAERLVELIDIDDGSLKRGDVLLEDVDAGAITVACLLAVHPGNIVKIAIDTVIELDERSCALTGCNERIPSAHKLHGDHLDDLCSPALLLGNLQVVRNEGLAPFHLLCDGIHCIEVNIPLLTLMQYGVSVAN